jgi:hypothetical protein
VERFLSIPTSSKHFSTLTLPLVSLSYWPWLTGEGCGMSGLRLAKRGRRDIRSSSCCKHKACGIRTDCYRDQHGRGMVDWASMRVCELVPVCRTLKLFERIRSISASLATTLVAGLFRKHNDMDMMKRLPHTLTRELVEISGISGNL